eukprot:TRINITY_DN7716_c0_g1_i3.p1 TRINITY_DN7716_c0_g1~~TRINITY_DN7716_c0_g1_i3.p1  ORF type:complete len:808 (+),score=132.99 TRINITY_DN7716_c0_g1_i3:383-2806(+)
MCTGSSERMPPLSRVASRCERACEGTCSHARSLSSVGGFTSRGWFRMVTKWRWFEREVAAVYSHGTLMLSEVSEENTEERHLLFLDERQISGGKFVVAAVMLEVLTGGMYWDWWEEDIGRSTLAAVLRRQPVVEAYAPRDIGSRSLQLLSTLDLHLCDRTHWNQGTGVSALLDWLAGSRAVPNPHPHPSMIQQLMDLDPGVRGCLAMACKVCHKFGLLEAVRGAVPQRLLVPAGQIDISPTTMEALDWEPYLQSLDCTVLRAGRVMLRRWLGSPLNNAARIRDRQEAVEELLRSKRTLSQIRHRLALLADLPRLLAHARHGRCSGLGLVKLVDSLERIRSWPTLDKVESRELTELLLALRKGTPDCSQILAQIDREALEAQDSVAGLVATEHVFCEVHAARVAVTEVECELDDRLVVLRRSTGIENLQLWRQGTESCLVQTDTDTAVPGGWVLVGSTQKTKRWKVPELTRGAHELRWRKAQLADAAAAGWSDLQLGLVREFGESIQLTAEKVSQLDCLQSLATVSGQPGWCKPQFYESDSCSIELLAGRHPVLEARIAPRQYVPNDITLKRGQTCVVISGANMGGKSSLMRMVCLLTAMAHTGVRVPAAKLRIGGVLDAILARMPLTDSQSYGSSFLAEMSEVRSVVCGATERSLVALDEVGRGTSTHDGAAIADSLLHHFTQSKNSPLLVFSTHYGSLTTLEQSHVRRMTMAYHHPCLPGDKLVFLYKLVNGEANESDSFGLHVAALAGLPHDCLTQAKSKCDEAKRGAIKLQVVRAIVDAASTNCHDDVAKLCALHRSLCTRARD